MPALPGVGCPALLQARAASPGILCVILGATISEQPTGVRGCPKEGNEVGEGSGRAT